MKSLDQKVRDCERAGDYEGAKRERLRARIVVVDVIDVDFTHRILDQETMDRIWVTDPNNYQAMFTSAFMREYPVRGCPLGTGNTWRKALQDLVARSGMESSITFQINEPFIRID